MFKDRQPDFSVPPPPVPLNYMHQPPPSMKLEYGQAASQLGSDQTVKYDGDYRGGKEENSSSTDGSENVLYSPTKPTTTPTKVHQRCSDVSNKGKLNMRGSRKNYLIVPTVQLLCIFERLLMGLLKFSQQNVNIHHRHR